MAMVGLHPMRLVDYGICNVPQPTDYKGGRGGQESQNTHIAHTARHVTIRRERLIRKRSLPELHQVKNPRCCTPN